MITVIDRRRLFSINPVITTVSHHTPPLHWSSCYLEADEMNEPSHSRHFKSTINIFDMWHGYIVSIMFCSIPLLYSVLNELSDENQHCSRQLIYLLLIQSTAWNNVSLPFHASWQPGDLLQRVHISALGHGRC